MRRIAQHRSAYHHQWRPPPIPFLSQGPKIFVRCRNIERNIIARNRDTA